MAPSAAKRSSRGPQFIRQKPATIRGPLFPNGRSRNTKSANLMAPLWCSAMCFIGMRMEGGRRRRFRPGRPTKRFSRSWLETFASRVTAVDVMPECDVVLVEFPAQEHLATVTDMGKIDQTAVEILDLDAHFLNATELD